MHSKDDIRNFLKKRRQDFIESGISSNLTLCSKTWEELARFLNKRGSVAGYAALPGEPNVDNLLRELSASLRTGLAYMARDSELMEFRSWTPSDRLEKSPFGFHQPPSTAPLLIPDVILVPLIGFDRALNRLGRGKGHYDRALVQLPRALKIGIAWSVQEVAAIPADVWDVPLDAVLTEREWIVRA